MPDHTIGELTEIIRMALYDNVPLDISNKLLGLAHLIINAHSDQYLPKKGV